MKICKIDNLLFDELRKELATPIRKLDMSPPVGSVNVVNCDAVTDGQNIYTVWQIEAKDGVPEADGMRVILSVVGGLPPHSMWVLGK